MPTQPPTAVFAMDPIHLPTLFPSPVLTRLRNAVRIDPALVVQDFTDPVPALTEAEILITGWGCPKIDRSALDAMPRLRTVLHSAGSVRPLLGEEFWAHGTEHGTGRRITVSSAAAANALPVAEYTLATILLAGKDAFATRDRYRVGNAGIHTDSGTTTPGPLIGNFGRRIGIIGASRVGRRLLELLRPFDFTVTVHDPFLDPAEAVALGAEALLPLDELLRTSDIVSLHAPDIPATYRMLSRERLALIPDGGLVINTSRGALIDPIALTEELVAGRLGAVLDVTEPEPLPADSPLHRLPNVFLTPHIAGSLGNELGRLGATVASEAERLLRGLPLEHAIRYEDLSRIA